MAKNKKKKRKRKHRIFWVWAWFQIILLFVVLIGVGWYYFGGYAAKVSSMQREAKQFVKESSEDTLDRKSVV